LNECTENAGHHKSERTRTMEFSLSLSLSLSLSPLSERTRLHQLTGSLSSTSLTPLLVSRTAGHRWDRESGNARCPASSLLTGRQSRERERRTEGEESGRNKRRRTRTRAWGNKKAKGHHRTGTAPHLTFTSSNAPGPRGDWGGDAMRACDGPMVQCIGASGKCEDPKPSVGPEISKKKRETGNGVAVDSSTGTGTGGTTIIGSGTYIYTVGIRGSAIGVSLTLPVLLPSRPGSLKSNRQAKQNQQATCCAFPLGRP
jgi:hypothetical protein